MRFFSTGNRVWCRAGARSSFFALLAGMLVVLLAVLLATPAFAQTPPTPGVSLSRNSNGDLLATVTSSDNSLNKLQAQLRSRAAGALAQWTNPASDKPVIITYDGAGLITVHTFYTDSPYYEEKPVIFTIDQLGEVQILAW